MIRWRLLTKQPSHEIEAEAPCHVIKLLDFDDLYRKLQTSESGELRGSHVEMCPPLSWREDKWKDSRESWLWIAPVPVRLEDVRIGLRLDWVKMSCDREMQHLWQFLKSAADPFHCFFLREGQFNQRIHWSPVQRIHTAPHGIAAEMSQTSMKSHPQGLLMDFSFKTLFGVFFASTQGGKSRVDWY